MTSRDHLIRSHEELMSAILNESRQFQDFYLWLEKYMPPAFFEMVSQQDLMLIAHNLMAFHMQDYFVHINLRDKALVMCLDSPEADLRILERYRMYGIKNYRAFVSKDVPPIEGISAPLRISVIHFITLFKKEKSQEPALPKEKKEKLRKLLEERNPKVTDKEFNHLLDNMNRQFLQALTVDRLVLALDMFFRAQVRDHCQYEVRYNENWEKEEVPSMQIMLAWRNTPRYDFLYRLARMIQRHGLVMKKVNATIINPYGTDAILVMALGLQGANGEASWDVADIPDFLRELVTMKYFASFDCFDDVFVTPGLVRGNVGNLLRTMASFIHQVLLLVDRHQYTLENIQADLCRHPELTVKMTEAFEHKFHPDRCDIKKYKQVQEELSKLISKLDTGHEVNDTRRKNVLIQGLNLVEFTLKTNFYRNNKTALSFRLDPAYLDHMPIDRKTKFPELPYAIFFIKGMHFFGFHIRFKDLARGGLRTVFTEREEQMLVERANIFTECYGLAYTQQKKNKDIPEGGSKAIIFLKPNVRIENEVALYQKEMEEGGIDEAEIEQRIKVFREEQRLEYLYASQRSFINSMLSLINCEADGKLKAKHVVDYWKRPEYIYLGPDENMHNIMIQWIAKLSKDYNYRPGGSFISSKPKYGINHKEYGVTSLGVNVYMHEVLQHLGINPNKDTFTVKISGGPDGDVAGNQINNLYRFYPKTAKLLAVTDGSGTINDPKGLDLKILQKLFKEGKPIKHYPPAKLHEGGFLLDRTTKRDKTAYVQQSLCYRKKKSKVVQEWIAGSEMNKLFANNVHQTVTDVFIPAGGRPRSIHQGNIESYFDPTGKPTSRAIVEGANLYLTPWARRELEKSGVVVFKDSSANKGGVICSSFEVLCGLSLGDEGFLKDKEVLVQEILQKLEKCAHNEAKLLLRTHEETGDPLTMLSDAVSEKINRFTYELLDYLDEIELSKDPKDPLIKCFLAYCLPTLRKKYVKKLISNIPDHHKKAIIASHIAAQMVYSKGLHWSPSIVDILPIIAKDPSILKCEDKAPRKRKAGSKKS